MLRCFLLLVSVSCFSLVTRAEENASDKILDRFVGNWRLDITRQGPEAPEERNFSTNEVVTKELKGRYLFARDQKADGKVKTLWLMTYDPAAKNYAWTFFNTQGLYGTEWRGTWDEATSTFTAKSSDAPPTWSSGSVTKHLDKDTTESSAWMKNAEGKSIFEMTSRKTRQPDAAAEKVLAAWRADPEPKAELTPELTFLDQLAGKWDVTATMKKAEWTPEETTTKSKVERQWILNRMFLQDTSTGEEGDENFSLFTYDPQRAQYRSWWFSSEGHTGKSTGQRAAAGNAIEWKSTAPDGKISTGAVQIADNDHHEWSMRTVDADGKVYFDAVWKCVRAKP